LRWADTYYWKTDVRETGTGAATTLADTVVPLAPTVVQPTTARHFGEDPYAPAYGGVNPSIGNFTTTVTDIQGARVGRRAELTRTSTSRPPRVGASGRAWPPPPDLFPPAEPDRKLLISSPDGRQERYAQHPDGTWAGPAGGTSTLRARSGGGWELERPDKMVYAFGADGKPVELRDSWGHRLPFSYTNDGHIATVTNLTSPGAMQLTWGAQGPSGASVIPAAQTDAPVSGSPGPRWTYGYTADGRLQSVCAPDEPSNACTTYTYYTTSSNPRAIG